MKNTCFNSFIFLFLLITGTFQFSSIKVNAQADYYYPGINNFSDNIPAPWDFLGYPIGSLHTRYDRIVAYMMELSQISERVSVEIIGYTNEYRPQIIVTITSPDNYANIKNIRAEHLKIADPDESVAEPNTIPIIVQLGYNVHGNEASGGEASMLTAYYLAASEEETTLEYLNNSIYFIEPVLNPDGRDRFANWVNMHKGDPMVSDPLDREHNEVWPGGRTNHYWYDLNRDWLPLANIESKARLGFYHKWLPNVVTDHHEMGTSSTFFFEPTKHIGSENPIVPRENYEKLNIIFAEYFSEAMDNIGSLYYSRESFDNSYPGYGSTYPDIQGGLGLLFEQASSRGHLQKTTTGELSFSFAIRNQLHASLATIKASYEQKTVLQEYQKSFFESAVSLAKQNPVKAYVFGDSFDRNKTMAFLDLVISHGIKCYEVKDLIEVDGKRFEKGSSYIVPTEQPQYRMVQTLFNKDTEIVDSVFYDASAWTMVLAYGLPYAEINKSGFVLGERINKTEFEPEIVEQSGYAYLLDLSDYNSHKALYHLQTKDIITKIAFKPFKIKVGEDVREYSYGTIMIPVNGQKIDPEKLYQYIKKISQSARVEFQGVFSGKGTEGMDLGSRNLRPVSLPKILMLIGSGVSSSEAGEVWHLLDSKINMPVTKVDILNFGRIGLDDYNTIVMVSGSYSSLEETDVDDLKQWLRDGGTLITIRSASSWAINQKIVNEKLVDNSNNNESENQGKTRRIDFIEAGNIRGVQSIGGSIFEIDIDLTNPLGFGLNKRKLPVYRNGRIFMQPSSNPYATVAQYTDDPLICGYVSESNLNKIKNSAAVIINNVGRGRVILFSDNPNFRGTWYGTNKLFFNAIFFGQVTSIPGSGY